MKLWMFKANQKKKRKIKETESKKEKTSQTDTIKEELKTKKK